MLALPRARPGLGRGEGPRAWAEAREERGAKVRGSREATEAELLAPPGPQPRPWAPPRPSPGRARGKARAPPLRPGPGPEPRPSGPGERGAGAQKPKLGPLKSAIFDIRGEGSKLLFLQTLPLPKSQFLRPPRTTNNSMFEPAKTQFLRPPGDDQKTTFEN